MTITQAANITLDQDAFYAWLNPEELTHAQRYDRERLLSEFVEVSEDTYEYFLGILPPMYFSGSGFAICEATTADIRLAFFRIDGRFFAAHISDFDRSRGMNGTREKIAAHIKP